MIFFQFSQREATNYCCKKFMRLVAIETVFEKTCIAEELSASKLKESSF
jgi:hypothetical protein